MAFAPHPQPPGPLSGSVLEGLQQRWHAGLERLRQDLAVVESSSGLGLLCGLGALVGALCGLVVLALVLLIDTLQGQTFPTQHENGFHELPLLLRTGLPIVGALALGLLFQWLRREDREGGIVHILERLFYYHSNLPVRAAVVQFLGSVLAVATGQSVGREGVAAHMGATTGSWFGRRLELPNNSVRTLVGCGTAAGIAASFNTPLGGVIFAMEVVMMEYSIVSFAPIILAAVSGNAVAHLLTDYHPQLSVAAGEMRSLTELPYLVLCGVVLGLISAGFTRLTGAITTAMDRIPVWARISAAGLVTGVAAIAFPQIMGVGFETINLALAGQFGVGLAVGIAAAKFIATSAATAAAIPGGTILPGFVIGASTGMALGVIGNWAAPTLASPPGFYALIGIGAMTGAMLQAPLTALVVLLELSGRTHVLLPAMLAVITAIVVARRAYAVESVFRMLLRRRGLDYRNDPVSQYLRRVSVAGTMNRRFKIVDRRLTRRDLMPILEKRLDWLMIRTGEKRATLMRPADVLRHLNEQDVPDDAEVDLDEVPGQRLEAIPIHLRASLQEAYELLDRQDAEALYVERGTLHGKVATYGVLTREAIEGAYHP